jgi:hypothetical protein
MKPGDDYDYTNAGLDGFLSRSIDNLDQVNLDAAGPRSTAIRYDSAQQSGAMGDRIRLGKITIDGQAGNIIGNDGTNDFLLIGEDGG